MYCTNCGAENSDNATFCNKCGTQLSTGQTTPQQTVKKKKPSLLKSITKSIIIVAVLLFIMACIGAGMIAPTLLNRNEGKGASDPTTIAQAFVLCCQYRDTSYMDDYLDERVNTDNIVAGLQDIIQQMDEQNLGAVNMDGITYEVGTEYEKDGYTRIDVTVHFAEIGLFGGNTIFGNRNAYTIYLHKNKTPDGEKWFMG